MATASRSAMLRRHEPHAPHRPPPIGLPARLPLRPLARRGGRGGPAPSGESAGEDGHTAGVICAKVARYAEHPQPDRLLHPLRRTGPGSGRFERISWDEALDLVSRKFLEAERRHGPEAVWPYSYAGTMGFVMRDGINRLRHVKKYSASTRPSAPTWPGPASSPAPAAMGPDPREMAVSDCVVIWGTSPVHTQVNVMTHAMRARKERGARIVAIDVYRNATMKQADMPLLVRGTDGALACAVMPRSLPRRPRTGTTSSAIRIVRANSKSICAPTRPGPPPSRGLSPGRSRLRGARRRRSAPTSPRLRVRAPAQRHRRHACRELHRGGDEGVGARGRRRVPQQRRHLPFRQDPDRGSRCAIPRYGSSTSRRSAGCSPAIRRRSVMVRPVRR